ncbi:hypothetical protein [Actinomadura kijaniata]|uniref:hypothetical protein n=1 Tax=Actinomadura kijaniata TaxID=46161 RepID=UPI00082D8D05|nr:hypothetical protein [Actinomadura kijaniata]
MQRALDATVWPLLNGGCHLATDTTAAIERAGFTDLDLRRVDWPQTRPPFPSAPHILGTATRPHTPADLAARPTAHPAARAETDRQGQP